MAGGRILLIEDEQRLRINLQRLLSAEGYTIIAAADGYEGLQCLQQTDLDLVITDMKMEGCDGFEVMDHIAAHCPDLPVIVITAYTSTESAIEALRKGAYDYITKPFEIEMIQASIERALEKVRLERELKHHMAELEQRVAELSTTTVSKRFVDNIIHSMADMLIVLHTDLTIVTANAPVTKTLGYDEDALRGQPFRTLCPADDLCNATDLRATIHACAVSQVERVFIARDSHDVPVLFSRSPMYDDRGVLQGIVCLAQDITERKRAQEALRESEARLRLLTQQIPAVLWTTDTDLRLTSTLGTGVPGLKLPLHHVKGMELWEFFQQGGMDFAAVMAHHQALKGKAVTQEVKYGAHVLHAHVEPLRDAAGTVAGTIGIALDISERKRQEEDRRRTAYEIHDGVAQLMVSAQQHLDTFEDLWLQDPAQAQPQLERGIDRLGQAIVEARRLMAQLHPVTLETQGLLPAVRRCAEELAEEAGWDLDYQEHIDELAFSPDEEVAVFRIIQEALTNAWKHACASKLHMHLEVRAPDGMPPTFHVRIQDWGQGFQVEQTAATPDHLGLLGMHERAQRLGGTCTVESQPGQGTLVGLQVPLNGSSPSRSVCSNPA